MEDRSAHSTSIRILFFALAGALFGALCAADSDVTLTLIAESFAQDRMHVVVDEFVRDGGGFRGGVGAIIGLFMGLGLFKLMSSPSTGQGPAVGELDFN